MYLHIDHNTNFLHKKTYSNTIYKLFNYFNAVTCLSSYDLLWHKIYVLLQLLCVSTLKELTLNFNESRSAVRDWIRSDCSSTFCLYGILNATSQQATLTVTRLYLSTA